MQEWVDLYQKFWSRLRLEFLKPGNTRLRVFFLNSTYSIKFGTYNVLLNRAEPKAKQWDPSAHAFIDLLQNMLVNLNVVHNWNLWMHIPGFEIKLREHSRYWVVLTSLSTVCENNNNINLYGNNNKNNNNNNLNKSTINSYVNCSGEWQKHINVNHFWSKCGLKEATLFARQELNLFSYQMNSENNRLIFVI